MSASDPPQQPSAPPGYVAPGAILARKYRVERILGQGGMGLVVEAWHLALEERVALKFLLPEFVQSGEFAERFMREARATVKIKSEHVARVADVGTLDTGAPYIVMEFLDGSDLARVLQSRGALPIPDALDFIIQGCEAIGEAHSLGIVHRDLKPANLFVTRRNDGSPLVKVLDFGISKVMHGVDNLTRTSSLLGSALYMSPEQMQQTRSVDNRTDIYALGIALFELLAGKPPFFADSLPQLCAEVLTGTPTPLRELRPEVPEPLAAIIEKAYARERADRYPSIGEFVIALAPFAPSRSYSTIERVARMAGLEPPPARPSSPPDTQRSLGAPGPSTPQRSSSPSSPPPAPEPQGRPSSPSPVPPSPTPSAPPPATDYIHIPDRAEIVVPGYTGPVSLKASAAFAKVALAAHQRPSSTKSSGKVVLAVFLAGFFTVAIAGIIAGMLVRRAADAAMPKIEPLPAPTAPTTPPRQEAAPPVIDPAPVETAAPAPVGTAGGAPSASSSTSPGSSASSAPTSAPSSAPTVNSPPKAPVPRTTPAPRPSASGKKENATPSVLSTSR